ncbi:MAG TPA: cation diffusion facilitator family transporter [Candidatus Acidoferrum sp.]|nr:cation diffusion facilitator family transporter [Candidatus Acidoferrum sp.]
MQGPLEGSYKLRSLKFSTIAISSVVLVELILGVFVGSLAIVSDGLHATLDAVTTLVLFLATRASLRPPDEEHMYGHEKFESIGGLTGGIALVGIACLIMYEAVLRILNAQKINFGFEYAGWIAIGYTFCIDFFRVGTFFRSRKSGSVTMKAGLYHAVADLSSTVIAFLGFGLAALGFIYGDALASMVLGVLLTYLSLKLVWGSGMELSDTISKDISNNIRNRIVRTKGIRKCVDLKIRRAGDKTFVNATVQVPDYLNFEEAHDLTSQIEADLKDFLGNAEVTIHTEPAEPELPTWKLVEMLAMDTQGVKGVHEIDTAFTGNRLYVTLHIYVDPKLSVEKADEIAGKLENKITKRLGDVENVTVHIEPYSEKKLEGPTLQEDEISRIIRELTQPKRDVFRVKGIVTYVADKKRHINIVCSFTKNITLEYAHTIASEIEEKVRTRFAETIVTVHTESE